MLKFTFVEGWEMFFGLDLTYVGTAKRSDITEVMNKFLVDCEEAVKR